MSSITEPTAIISAVVGCIGDLVAIAAYVLNRKSYRIAARQEGGRQPLLSIYLVSGEAHCYAGRDERFYEFLLRLVNASDLPNGLVDLPLCITYRRRSGAPVTVELRPEASSGAGTEMLRVPRQFAPREAVQGRARYKVPNGILAKSENRAV